MVKFVSTLVVVFALAYPAYAITHSKTIPGMGPALMGAPNAGSTCTTPSGSPPCTNPVAVVAMEVVDTGGFVDWIEKGWDQNWLCLGYSSGNFPTGTPNNYVSGTDASSNISTNYPVMSIFDVHPTTTNGVIDNWLAGGFGGSSDIGFITNMSSYTNATITEIATVAVAEPEDYNSSTHTCSAEGNDCHGFYHAFVPTGTTWPPSTPYVGAGDLLVWAITRGGSYCPGQYYLNQQIDSSTHLPYTSGPYPLGASSYKDYPSTAGGEITLGIHIYENNPGLSNGYPTQYQYQGPTRY